MKTKIYLLSLFILIIPILIQAQEIVWAKPFTDDVTLVSNFHRVCTDSEDNFYVMANFARKINFGSIELKSASKSPDITDAFIAKIDPDGETIFWGIQITGQGMIEGKALATDSKGNVYITGSFEGETTFGNTTITPRHQYGFFIAKYNSDGELQWVKQGGNYESKWSMATTYGYAIKTDESDNVYTAANVLGMYDDWVHDPSLPVEKQYLGKAYFEDQDIEGDEFYTGNHTVLIKLSTDGDFLWKRVGGLNIGLTDLAIDKNENIYMTGSIGGNSVFEGKKMEANGLSDIIVIKFDKEGKTTWIKQFGTGEPYSSGAYAAKPATDIEGGQFIAIDAAENVYFTGVHFNGARFDNQILASSANIKGLEVGNAFLGKLDIDGNIQWVKNAEGKGIAGLTGMICNSEGDVFLSGTIAYKKVTFNGQKAKGPFIMKFDSNGNTKWVDDADTRDKSWGKTVKVNVTYISSMAINHSEDFIYFTGNATRTTKESDYSFGMTTSSTMTETLMSISKIKTN